MGQSLETFHEVLRQGVEAKASDWHIKQDAPISLRISGDMVQLDVIPDKEFMEEVLDAMSDGTLRKKYVETGDLDVSYAPLGIGRFRVNVHRQRGLHAMTLRHVKSTIMNCAELSLPPILETLVSARRGIIIVCGTTGSGKSTTLAAMLDYVNRTSARHVITVEDPIEYEFQDKQSFFEQREVGLDTIHFSSALIHALRQDPDIIMVGEMRDKESFESALQAADTGHMVLSTLHATNASQAINRILDFYPKQDQDSVREALALNLQATIAQRLLPKAFGGGVIPVNEIMINTPVVRDLIHKNKLERLADAIAGGKEDGMQTFNMSLLDRINNGEISEEVALEASAEPDALKMNLKGIFLNTANQIIN